MTGGTAPQPGGPGGGAPEGARIGRPDPAGEIPLLRRLWSGGHLLPDGASGGPAHPVVRLFGRWVRRPLLPAARLWRRNIQLRVVATTLLMSLGVVLLLGLVVIGQVRNGLLDAKRHAAQGQAVGGFEVAEQMADRKSDNRGQDGAGAGAQDSGAWLNALVEQLASGGKGAYSVVALSSDSGETPYVASRGPRASGDVQPDSVPADLRRRVDEGRTAPYERYGKIVHAGSGDSEPALIIGKRLDDNNGDAYQLYYLFPFTQEEKSLSLVKGTLATAGVFVVVLLGAIAWVVVRQVVTPVRMAAGISERLAAGLLQERMKVTGEDDIARLGESFNKMAQNLQLKIQQLEELSRMQRRFVSDVSHELRTPLTTVRMAADVIYEAREDFDPITARSAELLWGQVDRFESLLSDLLEISRFDAGAAALEAEPIDLRDVVHRVVDGAEPLAEAKGTRILVRGAEAPVIAEADPRRVERVLRNLVVNAVEHGEGRDVVVRLATAGGAVAVAVRDYGVGLKPGEATRVFNRFWRADPARARTTGGTGLGLSIAVEDARLHGGWLQAWGEPGGGSQFRLTLPRTAGDVLRGSPVPLEPDDSRRNRRPSDAVTPQPAAERLAAVPAQPRSALPADAVAPSADPTALPGNGAGWCVAPRRRRPTGRGAARSRPPGRRHRTKGRAALVGADRADRRRFRRRGRRPGGRGLSAPVLLACGALLVSGCASMPDSGDVRRVDSSPRSDVDSQVRVYGVSPGKGEQPAELVSGFLEATTSDEENFGTAKEYLTKSAVKRWQPFAATTVLDQVPDVRVETDPGDRDGNGKTVVLSGKRIAVVDETHAYKPDEQPYEERIHLTLSGSEWRIDGPPRGLILGESDFQRIYRSVNKYYFADLGPDAEDSKAGDNVLVADPVYVRRRIDPVTATVKALLDGPTGWLEPVVSSSFPRGAALGRRDERLSLDDSNALKIRLNGRAAQISAARCARMAAQTLFTVQDLGEGSSEVSGVRLERQNGSELCALSSDAARAYAPDGVEGHPRHQYFVDSEHRMVRLSDDEDRPQPVPGPFGADDAGLGSVAVSRDERDAAGVTSDGSALYVTELAAGADRGKVRVRSRGGSVEHGLTAPSWDGLGGLWVADRDPRQPRLLRLRGGTGPADEVRLPELDGGRITALRVSADGSRIAMLVKRSGHTTLRLGRIERRGTADAPKLSVGALRAVAPKLEDVDTFSWAGDSRLVVAGRESDGVQQLQYVETDGSPSNVPEVPGPNGVQSIGASEDQTRPLIAETRENGIVRLLPNTDWKTVDQDGSAPVYPG